MSQTETSQQLVERWREGDQVAADELYRRYAERLCRLAEVQMDDRVRRRVGADDVVQSVFRTFFRRTARGEYSFVDSGALWSLLVRITLNKTRKHAAGHRAAKRDVGVEVHADSKGLSPEVIARDPSPEEAAVFVDELESLLSGLRDPEPEIVRRCLEGYSSPEIAAAVGCSRWTIRRVLARVGDTLKRKIERNSTD